MIRVAALCGLTAIAAGVAAGCDHHGGIEPTPGAGLLPETDVLEPFEMGTVQRLHTLDRVFLASQFGEADYGLAADAGIRTVLDFRHVGEVTAFDEPDAVESRGMRFIRMPYVSAEELTPELLDEARAILRDRTVRPLLVKCNSGNRVGAVWLAHRVLDHGLTWDAAMAEALEVGLKVPGYDAVVAEYVNARTRG